MSAKSSYSPLHSAGITRVDDNGRRGRATWRVVVWNERRFRAGRKMRARRVGGEYRLQRDAAQAARVLNELLDAKRRDGERMTRRLARLAATPCKHCGGVNGYHACDAAERGELAEPERRPDVSAADGGTWTDGDGEALAALPPVDSAAFAARDYSGERFRVERRHSGTEDGALWYVVGAEGTDADGGFLEREHAEDAAAELAKLATLTDGERAAVEYLRRDCPAPGDYGLAIIGADGRASEYRYLNDGDRNAPVPRAARRALVSGALADIREDVTLYIVDVDAERYDSPSAATVTEDAETLAGYIAEVASGEPSGDAREYIVATTAELAELIGILTPRERAEHVNASTLERAGFAKLYGRLSVPSSDADGLGLKYTTGAIAVSYADIETAASFAREWAADCQWTDAPDFASLSDSTVITLASAHYSGGLGQLVSDAVYDAARNAGTSREPMRRVMASEDDWTYPRAEPVADMPLLDADTRMLADAALRAGWLTDAERAKLAPVRVALMSGAPMPAERGAFGAAVDAGAASAAEDAASAWQSSGELTEDVRTVADILADLPAASVPRFLAHVAAVRPYNDPSAGGFVDGRDILAAVAEPSPADARNVEHSAARAELDR